MTRAALTHEMRLRVPHSIEDHAWLVELHNDPIVLRNLTNLRPITLRGHLDWWARVSADPTERRLLFEVDGQRVGFTKFYGIDRDNRCCVLGADIHKDHRGKGLAKAMWTMMLDVCFSPALEMHRVGLTTAEYNHVAQRVYRDLGFMVEGRLTCSLYRDGKYWDQICMYMTEADWRSA